MQSISWVNDSQRLNELCSHWLQQDFIALDTEFIREKTFYPIAGLLQISSGEQAYLLDPLTINDWSAFAQVLQEPGVVKVVHSCGEDLEVLLGLTGVLPVPLYDTQLAAAFIDLGFSWSYARLVKHFLDIDLAKDVTRSDWLQRPLTEQQQDYAAQDVTYLAQLYPLLDAQLSEQKRQWLLADGARLVTAQLNPVELADFWQTAKQAWRLNAQQTAVLQVLSLWREEQARKRDLPRNRVLREQVLFALALKQPSRLTELAGYEDLHAQTIRRDGEAILERIKYARALPESQWPQPMPQPLPVEANKLTKGLRSQLAEFAKQQSMAAEIVLKKKVVEDLLRTGFPHGPYQLPDSLTGWRKEMLGQLLLTYLEQESK